MVSVLWPGVGYRDLTNVLAPQVLSARQVCELYRRRCHRGRLRPDQTALGFGLRMDGIDHAVQLQIYATLIFSAVLVTICRQIAQALGEPLERISVEMVFRAFSHYSRAVQRGESSHLVSFLAEHAKLLGIVKRRRRSHRERQHLEASIWGNP